LEEKGKQIKFDWRDDLSGFEIDLKRGGGGGEAGVKLPAYNPSLLLPPLPLLLLPPLLLLLLLLLLLPLPPLPSMMGTVLSAPSAGGYSTPSSPPTSYSYTPHPSPPLIKRPISY